MSEEGLKKGWLANWLITERVTGLGGSCIQLTQSDMSAHGLIVVKEITHTHTEFWLGGELVEWFVWLGGGYGAFYKDLLKIFWTGLKPNPVQSWTHSGPPP